MAASSVATCRSCATVLDMPWVADISIRRVWPDKLNMVVTERVPLARWGDDVLMAVVYSSRHRSTATWAGQARRPAGSEQRVVEFLQTAAPAADARA